MPPRKKRVKKNNLEHDPRAACLVEMFPPELINLYSKEEDMIQRQRKLDSVVFFWTLIMQFGVNHMRSLRGMHRSYNASAVSTMEFSSFLERFTPNLEGFLHRCVLHAIEFQAKDVSRELSDKLKHFRDVLIQDSTILRLPEALAGTWPAALSSKKAAGVKVSSLMSVVGDGPKRVEIVPERTAEVKTIKLGPWVRNNLLLFDLGFFKLPSFRRIDQYGGHFVTRLKKNVNATIVGVNKIWRGNAKPLIGEDLWSVAKKLKRGIIDVEVEFDVTSRRYRGKQTTTKWRCRAVGVYNLDEKKYHLYLTNVPLAMMSPEDVAVLYGARWEIELIFKELKSYYRLDKINSDNPDVVKCLIWVAILVMICSRRILHLFRKRNPEKAHRYTHLRSAMIFTEFAYEILLGIFEILGIEFGYEDRMRIQEMLLEDPNGDRKHLMDPIVK